MAKKLKAPDLRGILAFRGVHALCTVNENGLLHATHYASVLAGGSDPLWGIWTVYGTFLRFAGSRAQIEQTYPDLVWRRKVATWSVDRVDDLPVPARKRYLREHFATEKGEA